MSYILDALRRSQAERDRGQVPGLHAQPELGGLRSAGGAVPTSTTPWLALLAGAVVVLGGALAWSLWRTSAPAAVPATAAAAATAAATAATPAPTPAVAVAVAPDQPVATTPSPVLAPLPTVVSAPKATKPVQAPAPAAVAASGAAASVTAPVTAPVAVPASSAALPPKPALAAAPTVPAIPVLTADMQRSWPPLVLGGSVWSDNPSARFVILGGQVVREGEAAAGGVVVEQILPKAVVLRWRDQRASLPL